MHWQGEDKASGFLAANIVLTGGLMNVSWQVKKITEPSSFNMKLGTLFDQHKPYFPRKVFWPSLLNLCLQTSPALSCLASFVSAYGVPLQLTFSNGKTLAFSLS